ncbi:MAG TPA: M17 family metallopeptidase, partial [Candidatus Gracilibacteria bacterium]|nr:M17 family metallopeptidase [Candidatus Gracilibacteria bacterium]
SDTDANMVILEHKPKGTTGKPIVLVGKGITFDSGGYNLKSGAWFADMKMDMSGAAVVMNVLGLCAKLGIKKHVIGITPITDNLIGPKAQKVADIVTTYSGKTVEVNNTDAEGRLILCDAMAYAVDKFKPSKMIDVATLTGACMMALGEKYAGLFANNEGMIEGIKKASDATDELVWHMPLHPDHTKEMKSRIADLQNVNYGNKGMAGASTAAAFLQEFVGKTDWAHLDIAGTAFVSKPKKYESPMGTGFGVRLLTNYLENL